MCFRGNTREALSTYGLVIPEDSPNTCTCGDEELDGYANFGTSESPITQEAFRKLLTTRAENNWGGAGVNVTQVGNFTKAPYKFKLAPLSLVERVVKLGAGIGRILR